jgi:hypothetical protein
MIFRTGRSPEIAATQYLVSLEVLAVANLVAEFNHLNLNKRYMSPSTQTGAWLFYLLQRVFGYLNLNWSMAVMVLVMAVQALATYAL